MRGFPSKMLPIVEGKGVTGGKAQSGHIARRQHAALVHMQPRGTVPGQK